MTIAYDAFSGTTDNAVGVTVTWAHTCSGVSRILVVGCLHHDAQSITGITYNAVALTKAKGPTIQGNASVSLWYLINPATGANNIVVTLNAASTGVYGAISLTSAIQSSQPRNSNEDQGNKAGTSHAVTSLPGDIIVGFIGEFGLGTTFTPGAGQTERYDQALGAITGAICHETATGASTTTSWTVDGGVTDVVSMSASFRTPLVGTQAIIIA